MCVPVVFSLACPPLITSYEQDSATHAIRNSDAEGADLAARLLVREAVFGLKPVLGPVQPAASRINNAGDSIAALDNVTRLLNTLSKFNSLVHVIAEVWDFISQRRSYLPCSTDPSICQGGMGCLVDCLSGMFVHGVPDVCDGCLTNIHF